MYQFTEKDIGQIKQELKSLIYNIQTGREILSTYVDIKLLTNEQQISIIGIIKKSTQCSVEPIHKELLPLVDIVKYNIESKRISFEEELRDEAREFNWQRHSKYKARPDYFGEEYFEDYAGFPY